MSNPYSTPFSERVYTLTDAGRRAVGARTEPAAVEPPLPRLRFALTDAGRSALAQRRVPPGTTDLRLDVYPSYMSAAEVAEQRQACDADGHASLTYNPVHGVTYCGCALVTYPGDHGQPPVRRVITPRGKYTPTTMENAR